MSSENLNHWQFNEKGEPSSSDADLGVVRVPK